LHAAGVGHAVATCGTALADGHVRLLTNFARRIVLAYDADSAGQAAADRFYEWERKFEVDIAVAALPANQDPADLARRDPDGLRQAIANARPYLAFRLERALDRADLRSPEGRARAAAAAMSVVTEHPNPLVRDQYLMQIADRCQIDPARLRAGEWGGPAAPAGRQPSWGRTAAGPLGAPGRGTGLPGGYELPVADRPSTGAELEALRLAIHRPETVADRLEEALFAEELHRSAFRALAGAGTLHEAIGSADPDTADLLARLAVGDSEVDADDVMIRLLERAGSRALDQLQREARSAPAPEDYAAVIGWLKLALEELRSPQSGREAEARLVPWLRDRSEGADE
ncbi:MAG TPA: toprim domain-containing protein, partial [Acidimicrobiales bacterium]